MSTGVLPTEQAEQVADQNIEASLERDVAADFGALQQSLRTKDSEVEQTPPEPKPVVEAKPAEKVAEPAKDVKPAETKPEGIKPEVEARPEDSVEFKKFLELYGGDRELAARHAIDTNNRAAGMARALREAGIDPVTLKRIEAEPEVQTPEAVEVSPQQIEEGVKYVLGTDQVYSQIAQDINKNTVSITEQNGVIEGLSEKIKRTQWEMDLPVTKADTYAYGVLSDQLRTLNLEKVLAEGKLDRLETAKERLSGKLDDRFNQAVNHVQGHLTKKAQENTKVSAEKREQAETERLKRETIAEWEFKYPLALEKAFKAYGVSDEDQTQYADDVRGAAFIHKGAIEDIYGFVDQKIKSYVDRAEKHHRSKMSDYGKLAQERTAQSTTPAVAKTPPRQQETQQPLTEYDIERDLENSVTQDWGALRGR